MCDVINSANAAGLYLTPSPCDTQKEAHPSYYIKGLCNARCEWAGDHRSYPTGGDRSLWEWSRQATLSRKSEWGGDE